MKYHVYEIFEAQGHIEEFCVLETDDAEEAREWGRRNLDKYTQVEIRYNITDDGYDTLEY